MDESESESESDEESDEESDSDPDDELETVFDLFLFFDFLEAPSSSDNSLMSTSGSSLSISDSLSSPLFFF